MRRVLTFMLASCLACSAHGAGLALLGAGKKPAAAGGQGGVITWQSMGAVATTSGATSLGVVAPASIASGEKLYLLLVLGTSTNDNPANPSGWTEVGTLLGGEGAWGSNSGPRRVKVWERTADGTEGGTTVTINWTTAAASTAGGAIVRLSGANVGWQTTASTSGTDTTAGTDWSVTGASTEHLVNDLFIVLSGGNSGDASASSSTISASGVTFGATTQRTATNLTGGNQGHFTVASAAVTAGATAAPNIAITFSAATTGASLFVRVRNAQ